ncbi:MAG: NAD(P)-dependent oxidoreductase [Verrucomicrobiia bacterium]
MRIFVTGATGFLGSHVVNLCHERGHQVRAHRREASRVPRIPLDREPEWLTGPLDALGADAFAEADVIMHLAAHTPNHPYDTFERCFYWNVLVALRMLEAAFQAGVRRWIVAGSCFEYGRSALRYAEIPTDAPLEPVGSYPTSKAAASVGSVGLAQSLGASLLIGRIFQMFGPGEDASRFWPSLKRAALAGEDFEMSPGDQIRDFVPVEHVALWFVNALDFPAPQDGTARMENIGTGRPQTLRAFAEEWWSRWQAKGELKVGAKPHRPQEVMRFVPAISEASLALASPRTS